MHDRRSGVMYDAMSGQILDSNAQAAWASHMQVAQASQIRVGPGPPNYLALEESAPYRDAQPDSGVNAALGSAFYTSATQHVPCNADTSDSAGQTSVHPGQPPLFDTTGQSWMHGQPLAENKQPSSPTRLQEVGSSIATAVSRLTQSTRCNRRSSTPPGTPPRGLGGASASPFVATPFGVSAGLQAPQAPRAAMGLMTGGRQTVPVQFGMDQSWPTVAEASPARGVVAPLGPVMPMSVLPHSSLDCQSLADVRKPNPAWMEWVLPHL